MLASRLPRPISQDEKAAYRRDGAAVIRGILDLGWVERMQGAIDRILADPGEASVEYTPKGKAGRYYGDFFVWRRDEDFRAFMAESALPELAAELMGANSVHFFYDQLLVKEPLTEEPTPWHQDLPYWPVRGEHIISVWVPFDPVTRESGAVTYLRGSHRAGKMYRPTAFGKDSGFGEIYERIGLEAMPDIEATAREEDKLWWSMVPGDVLVHHPLTFHYAGGNASASGRRRGLALRYLGDDAVWDARPGTFMSNPKVQQLLPPLDFADGDSMEGEVFPQVWPR